MIVNIKDKKNLIEIKEQLIADWKYKGFHYNEFLIECLKEIFYPLDESLEIL